MTGWKRNTGNKSNKNFIIKLSILISRIVNQMEHIRKLYVLPYLTVQGYKLMQHNATVIVINLKKDTYKGITNKEFDQSCQSLRFPNYNESSFVCHAITNRLALQQDWPEACFHINGKNITFNDQEECFVTKVVKNPPNLITL